MKSKNILQTAGRKKTDIHIRGRHKKHQLYERGNEVLKKCENTCISGTTLKQQNFDLLFHEHCLSAGFSKESELLLLHNSCEC